MQTLGTALQLVGSTITLGGLVYAWHVTSGRLVQWRDDLRNRLTRLRESMDKWLSAGPPTPAQASFGIHTTIGIGMSTHAEGRVDGGTTEDRLARLEVEIAKLADKLTAATDALRTEIDQARATVLDESKALSDTIRLKDIYPALFGLVVSIAGMSCQLIG